MAGKPSVLASGGIRLVQPGASGTAGTASVVAGGSTATGNLITIGGKQVLLTSKPFAQQGQLQQVTYHSVLPSIFWLRFNVWFICKSF